MSQADLTINGYELINCISTGNVSQVWEVKQAASGQAMAMKLLLPEALSESEHKSTMRHEAAVMKQLEHPNIVRFVETKVSRKLGYIVMELFRSQNLKAMIHSDLHSVHLRLRKFMECSTQAFAYMHEKNWLHKDIKPENILLTKGGEVRVIDLSLAARPSSSVGRMVTRKKSIAIQGTRTYIAPEQIRREKITVAADIYSLGVVLFEALTGRPPFMGANPNALLMAHVRERPAVPSFFHRNISPEADDLVRRMLSKKPQDRPESMQQIFSEVRSIKLFKQEPEVHEKDRLAAIDNERSLTIDQRLDSRADAARTERFGVQPAQYKQNKVSVVEQTGRPASPKPVPQPTPQPARQPAAAAAPAPQQPMPQQPMPQYGMYPPGMQPMPMPPMMPYPSGPPMGGGHFPPGMYPQHPGMPPGQPAPPMQPPLPPQMPAPAQQSPPRPPQPAPPTSAPPAAPPQKPAPAEKEPDVPDNLDWLTVS